MIPCGPLPLIRTFIGASPKYEDTLRRCDERLRKFVAKNAASGLRPKEISSPSCVKWTDISKRLDIILGKSFSI